MPVSTRQAAVGDRGAGGDPIGHQRGCIPTGATRLALLGGFRIVHRGARVELPAAGQRLVAFLALERRPVPRAYVAGHLWPETPDRRAAANLRSALWRLGREDCLLVDVADDRLALAGEVALDVAGLLDVDGQVSAAADQDALGSLVDCYDRELLPGWYTEWLWGWRERWRHLRLHALEQLSRVSSSAGRHRVAVDAALAAVRVEPLRETAQRTLIEAHLAEGNQSEALRQYEQYCHLLATELGLAPSSRLTDLLEESVTRR